ncbi:acyltransferase family protein [Cellulomonas rhizosphaerae]|uniref:acyltransferase family protein n=1 Tax=Cellulomonas rhizosphaerae TaxID=2293719 RepID=UPI0013142543|nr:acyltransferase family protein [Cellulomonas rhizosphaerae]
MTEPAAPAPAALRDAARVPGGHERRSEPQRTDIQALRAFAVLAVVLYHLWPNRLTGGYIGVDVFFVISGYLIGAHLLRELTSRGSIALGTFWARRAKRLLPASLLVLALSAVAVVVLVPRSLWSQFLSEVGASALYVENWLLAHDAVDYLASSNSASPVRHYWTLSVEEQFYVGLPLLLLASAWLAHRHRARLVQRVRVTLGAAVLASFVYSVVLMASTPSVAYFSTLTRAWEFGAGALLATYPLRRRLPWRPIVPWIGVALLVATCLAFDAETPFPGATALLPVAGAVVAIASGDGTSLARLGAWRPVALIGETSYGAYLWHWPLIVLLPFVTGHRLGTLDKLTLLLATFLLAALSTYLVENPVRFRLLGSACPRVVGLWTLAGMAFVLVLVVVPLRWNDAQMARDAAAIAAASDPSNPCFGAGALLNETCADAPSPAVLAPDPTALDGDDSNRAECFTSRGDATFRVCPLGPATYSRHILAVGDSHNNTLIAAYERIAEERGWRIDVAGRGGCYWTAAEQVVDNPSTSDACRSWRTSAAEHIAAATDLDAIIVTNSRMGPPVEDVPGKSLEQATADGMVAAWDARPDPVATPVIAIGDNPGVTSTTIPCVEKYGLAAATRCVIPLDAATRDADAQELAATSGKNAHFVDTTRLYCTPDGCPAVVGGVIVYRDVTSHLTATYARTVADYLGNQIEAVLTAG